jgi:hypothetical protein
MSRRGYYRYDPVEEALYEALMYHYWGAKEESQEMIIKIAERVINGDFDEPKTTKKATATKGVSDFSDDVDYDAAVAYAEYPWDGWRFRDDKH